jgi:hypothetical protein
MKSTLELRWELCTALESPEFNEHEFNKQFKLEYMYAYRRKTQLIADFEVELVWCSKGHSPDDAERIFSCWHRYNAVSFLPQFIEVTQKAGFCLDTAASNVTSRSVYVVSADPLCAQARSQHEQLCKQVRLDCSPFQLHALHMYSFHNGQSHGQALWPKQPRRMHVCLEWGLPEKKIRFLCWHSWEKVCHVPRVVQCAKKMGFDAAHVAHKVLNDSVYTIAADPACVPIMAGTEECDALSE